MLSDLGGLNGHTCRGGFEYMFILASISANISRSTYSIGKDVNLCHQHTIFHFQQVKHDFIQVSATAASSIKKIKPFYTAVTTCTSKTWPHKTLSYTTPVYFCTIAITQMPLPPPSPPLLLITCISHPHSSLFKSSL